MKSTGKNYLKILIVILLASGLIYAFYNVLVSRIQNRENQKNMEAVTGVVLKNVEQADRMECKTAVYLDLESKGEEEEGKEEDKKDDSRNVHLIHDFEHDRLYIGRGGKKEIIDYREEAPYVFSQGISPVYSKADTSLKRIPQNQWTRYVAEQMYGVQWKEGKNDQISYGYLKDGAYLQKIKKQGKDKIGEKEYTKYQAVISNSLRNNKKGEESDNEFRKTLSSHGLNVMDLKKGYPEVYKMLKDTYNKDTEEMYIWVDENGNMARIEKDHTFQYYLDIMKENSERIEEKVGQHGYPKVYCRQDYTYSPTCGLVEIPKEFGEL